MTLEQYYPLGSYVEVMDEDEESVIWRGFVRGYGQTPLFNKEIAPWLLRIDNGHPTETDEHGFGRGWTKSMWVSPRHCTIV